MKVNPLSWAALIAVVLFPFSVFGQQGPQLRMVPLAPPPHVQKCMQDMQLYRQFFLFRGGGLTIEESRISNGFSVRIAKFVSGESKRPLDPDIAEKLDAMLVEVYDLPEEDFNNPVFQRGWGSLKMSTCVDENSPEPTPEPEAPTDYKRMIPEPSV